MTSSEVLSDQVERIRRLGDWITHACGAVDADRFAICVRASFEYSAELLRLASAIKLLPEFLTVDISPCPDLRLPHVVAAHVIGEVVVVADEMRKSVCQASSDPRIKLEAAQWIARI